MNRVRYMPHGPSHWANWPLCLPPPDRVLNLWGSLGHPKPAFPSGGGRQARRVRPGSMLASLPPGPWAPGTLRCPRDRGQCCGHGAQRPPSASPASPARSPTFTLLPASHPRLRGEGARLGSISSERQSLPPGWCWFQGTLCGHCDLTAPPPAQGPHNTLCEVAGQAPFHKWGH